MAFKMKQKTSDDIRLYHTDHLGSTALVTDLDGEVTQNVAYIPYGEIFVEQRNGSWASPYLFNAKELDEETGLYYYGARYLDPTGTRWLSVDPLFEKYVGMTPYNYCHGNPIVLVDPDGRGSYYSSETGELMYTDAFDDSRVYIFEWNEDMDKPLFTITYIGQNEDFKDLTNEFNETLKETADFFEKALKAYENAQSKNPSLAAKVGGYGAKLKFFNDMVTDGAEYDIKSNKQSPFYSKGDNFQNGKVEYAFYDGKLFRYDDFGNFNYGVAGKAFGFSDFILEAGAGANQLTKSSSPHDGPYFDDKRDNYMIRQGFIYYNTKLKK